MVLIGAKPYGAWKNRIFKALRLLPFRSAPYFFGEICSSLSMIGSFSKT
jgi:hypothetical protein